ncbi:MAG: hypothetical protein ABFS46_14555, partial [Myxococcota bacterium]
MPPQAHRRRGSPPRSARIAQAAGLALLLLGASAPAQAASLLSATVAFGPGHDGDLENSTAPNYSVRTSTVDLEASDASSFLTRFAATLGVDAEAGGASENLQLNVQYVVTLGIVAAVGETWDLEIDHSRMGALTLVNDGSGRASAAAHQVFTTITGATLTSGTLDLADLGTLTGPNGGDLPFNQSTTAILSGTGTQTVTLQFDFQLRTHTIPQGGNGDEASVRMGIESAIDSLITAGEYPGIGSGVFLSDGQFVSGR